MFSQVTFKCVFPRKWRREWPGATVHYEHGWVWLSWKADMRIVSDNDPGWSVLIFQHWRSASDHHGGTNSALSRTNTVDTRPNTAANTESTRHPHGWSRLSPTLTAEPRINTAGTWTNTAATKTNNAMMICLNWNI